MENNFQDFIKTTKAGIDRFYSEGYIRWTREKAQILFDGYDLNDQIVCETLKEWETQGVIRFIGEEECYFEVLKEFGN